MPGDIRAGVSQRHRLPGQAEIDQAEAQLLARTQQGTRRPLPPPAPLPPELLDDGQEAVSGLDHLTQLARGPQPRQPIAQAAPAPSPMADPPHPSEDETTFPLEGTISLLADGVHVQLRTPHLAHQPAITASGDSLAEALGLAASQLEEALGRGICPHCGQLMPEEK